MTAEIGTAPPAAKPPRCLKWLGSRLLCAVPATIALGLPVTGCFTLSPVWT